jgi:hypothetical protein
MTPKRGKSSIALIILIALVATQEIHGEESRMPTYDATAKVLSALKPKLETIQWKKENILVLSLLMRLIAHKIHDLENQDKQVISWNDDLNLTKNA